MWESALVGARLVQFVSALVLCGAPLFYLYGLRGYSPPASVSPPRKWPDSLLRAATVGVLLGSVLWVVAQSVLITGEPGSATDPAILWTVLSDTSFGRMSQFRIVLALSALGGSLIIRRPSVRWIMMAILGGIIAASFAWTGHGGIDEGIPGTVHLWADVLHLLAAAVWLGALVPLLVLLSRAAPTEAEARGLYSALAAFSGIGMTVVSVLAITGLINSWFLIGLAQWTSLFSTEYGILLSAKLILFGLMLLLAALNRYRLTPRLAAGLEQKGQLLASLSALRRSVIAETGLGLAVLWLVSWFGTLAPPNSGM